MSDPAVFTRGQKLTAEALNAAINAQLSVYEADARYLQLAGGTLAGDLILSGSTFGPTNALNGTLADARYLQLAGGTLAGNLVLSGSTFGPTNALNGALADARYLQLAGGTLTGAVNWSGTNYLGFVAQSLTTTQRDALSSPANGGFVYNTTDNRHQFRANGAWQTFARLSGDTLTGAMLFPLGAVGTPSVSFDGDTNTGVWSPGADIVAVSTGGTERWRWSAAGGLTQSTQSVRLQLAFSQLQMMGDANRGWRLTSLDTGSAPGIGILWQYTTNNFGSGTVAICLDPNGSVGVAGTTSPTVALHVNGAIRHLTYTVATLPAAGTAGAGTRAAVTDANATTFNAIVAGGGANFVPVISNGTNWLIG